MRVKICSNLAAVWTRHNSEVKVASVLILQASRNRPTDTEPNAIKPSRYEAIERKRTTRGISFLNCDLTRSTRVHVAAATLVRRYSEARPIWFISWPPYSFRCRPTSAYLRAAHSTLFRAVKHNEPSSHNTQLIPSVPTQLSFVIHQYNNTIVYLRVSRHTTRFTKQSMRCHRHSVSSISPINYSI